jgi:K+-sensing histidine kinase KdpD
MRRNAESLLLLAGAQPSRRWTAPIPITDVVRSALGEVDGFERVKLGRLDPVTVAGGTAAELAHLLAELLENAVTFSPPTRSVHVQGVTGREGYVLTIIDGGLGMNAGDLEAANRRLSGAESFTVAPSRYLGHYVAGHIAALHGVTVRVGSGSGRGLTATVVLPAALLVGPAMRLHATTALPTTATDAGWLPRSPFIPSSAIEGRSPPRSA